MGGSRLVGLVCEDPAHLSLTSRLAGVWRSLVTETVLETLLLSLLYTGLSLWRWCWQSSPLQILSEDSGKTPTLFILTKVGGR